MTWIQATLWKLKEQGGAPVSGPIKIHMWIGESETQIEILPTEKTRPKGMRADIDGLLKAPFDILKTAGLIDDDRMVQDTHVQWRP